MTVIDGLIKHEFTNPQDDDPAPHDHNLPSDWNNGHVLSGGSAAGDLLTWDPTVGSKGSFRTLTPGTGVSVTVAAGTVTVGLSGAVAAALGGTGLDTSASSGVPSINAGGWVVNNVLTANRLLYASASNTLATNSGLTFDGSTLTVSHAVAVGASAVGLGDGTVNAEVGYYVDGGVSHLNATGVHVSTQEVLLGCVTATYPGPAVIAGMQIGNATGAMANVTAGAGVMALGLILEPHVAASGDALWLSGTTFGSNFSADAARTIGTITGTWIFQPVENGGPNITCPQVYSLYIQAPGQGGGGLTGTWNAGIAVDCDGSPAGTYAVNATGIIRVESAHPFITGSGVTQTQTDVDGGGLVVQSVEKWIIAGKNGNVAHGVTALGLETNTYLGVGPAAEVSGLESAGVGGAGLAGLSENKLGLYLYGVYTTDDTGKTGSSLAAVLVDAAKKSGAGVAAPGANANLFGVAAAGAPVFLVDQSGRATSLLTANGATGYVIKRYTDTAPTGNFVDYLTAAGASVYTVSVAGAVTSGSWTATAVGAAYGGTGQTTYAVGDVLYASASTTLSKLAAVAAGQILKSAGVTTAPEWSSSLVLSGTSGHVVGSTSPSSNAGFVFSGTQDLSGAAVYQAAVQISTAVTGGANQWLFGLALLPTIVEAASGDHGIMGAIYASPTFTNGAATATYAIGMWFDTFTCPTGTTNGITLNVVAPTGATTNWAAAFTGRVDITSQGLVIGAPTGGNKGGGTINVATDIYKNDTAYTNPAYVFEKHYTGRIVANAGKLGSDDYDGLRPIKAVEAFTRAVHELPLMTKIPDGGLFDRGDLLLATVEEAYLYLFDHERRVERLEAENAELRAELDALRGR